MQFNEPYNDDFDDPNFAPEPAFPLHMSKRWNTHSAERIAVRMAIELSALSADGQIKATSYADGETLASEAAMLAAILDSCRHCNLADTDGDHPKVTRAWSTSTWALPKSGSFSLRLYGKATKSGEFVGLARPSISDEIPRDGTDTEVEGEFWRRPVFSWGAKRGVEPEEGGVETEEGDVEEDWNFVEAEE